MYRTTKHFKNLEKDKLKFRKTDSIWNQSFQIIVKMRLSKMVWLGRKDSCSNTKILVETSDKVFKSAVRL